MDLMFGEVGRKRERTNNRLNTCEALGLLSVLV
jgi:hypothetical protein